MSCIEHTGYFCSSGYGIFRNNKKTVYMHRHVYALKHGPIPDNLVVRHTCDNRRCVNPEHLVLGTQADNNHDRLLRNPESYSRSKKGTQTFNVASRKLTKEQVLLVRTSSESTTYFAKLYGVSAMAISSIRRRMTYRD